ncbi:MAG TPA: nucleotide exchange factor GrpE [Solirubrobacteraceae bacterium]|jgi:molecular chaperone GrpE
MTTPKQKIAEALDGSTRPAKEGAPKGAPEPSVSAGEPEPPVGPAVPNATGAADTAEAAETDHERQLEHDLEELAAKAEKADEYLDLAQRTRADFENYRRRATREAAVAQERGIAKLAKELLPAVDNLDRALDAASATAGNPTDSAPQDNGTAATLVSGIKLVHKDVIAALARAGIERFSPEGERFDPQLHEAVAQLPVEGTESGTVVEVYQRGYRLGEVVIRPARVVVAA